MSKKYNILVPDELHINQRNFPSFHKFVASSASSIKFIKARKDWIALYGNYESKASELNEKARVLACLPADTLFGYTVKGIPLFKIARAEALARVAVQPEWYSTAYPENARGIFDKLLEHNKPVLMQCLAAAWDWLDFWNKTLADEKTFTHCCVFSGSLIYQRALIELLRCTPTKVMVMETFFTGNDYYCEEKYGPIANNCEIRYKAVYGALAVHLSANDQDKERMKAINKLILARNKNVEQPESCEIIQFTHPGKIVTIIGQVVNDFSLLEYKNTGLASIAFYKNLIAALASHGFNVIFKAHPWEEKKINIRKAFTRNVLMDFVAEMPEEIQSRIKIIDHYPIGQLFGMSFCIAGLNSQGLLEAAFHGLKAAQFGNAFFGKAGFTHDYALEQVSEFASDLASGKIDGTLNLAEYRLFEEFAQRLLQRQLVSIHNSGVSRLNAIFEVPDVIGLAKKSALEKAKPDASVAVKEKPPSLDLHTCIDPVKTCSGVNLEGV